MREFYIGVGTGENLAIIGQVWMIVAVPLMFLWVRFESCLKCI